MSERKIFVVSDTHFFHNNIIRYCDRPFDSVHHMNETMVNNWNKVVKDDDIVYHLGDVYMGAVHVDKVYDTLARLKGRKRLILGNHDNGKDQVLHKIFQKITMWRMFPEYNALLTHVPVHESSLRDGMVNLHGHIHNKRSPSARHVNVSVEMQGYTPTDIRDLV